MRTRTAVAALIISALAPMAPAQTSTATQALYAAQQSNQLVDVYLSFAFSYVSNSQPYGMFLASARVWQARSEMILMQAEAGNQNITTARLYEQLAEVYTQAAVNTALPIQVAITFIQAAQRYQQWSEFFLYMAITQPRAVGGPKTLSENRQSGEQVTPLVAMVQDSGIGPLESVPVYALMDWLKVNRGVAEFGKQQCGVISADAPESDSVSQEAVLCAAVDVTTRK